MIQLPGLPGSRCESALAVRITKVTGSQNIHLPVSFSLKMYLIIHVSNRELPCLVDIRELGVGRDETGRRDPALFCLSVLSYLLLALIAELWMYSYSSGFPCLGKEEADRVGTLPDNWLQHH